MQNQINKEHWESIYKKAKNGEMSWFQQVDLTSIDIISQLGLSPYSKIIDIGGGDSLFAYNLLMSGYLDVSVLDISGIALEKAQESIGDMAPRIQWIEADINEFKPSALYDFWHDRAVFHFLSKNEVDKYKETLLNALNSEGLFLLATFSNQGPDSCSSLPVTKYSKESLTSMFESDFDRIRCDFEDHITPAGKVQNFIYCLFKRRNPIAKIKHSETPDGYYNRALIK